MFSVDRWRPRCAESERGRRPVILCFPPIQYQSVEGAEPRGDQVFSVQQGVKRQLFRSAARSSITTGVPLHSYVFMNRVCRSVARVIYGVAALKRSQTAQVDGRFPSQARETTDQLVCRPPRPSANHRRSVKCHATLKGLNDLHACAWITCTTL